MKQDNKKTKTQHLTCKITDGLLISIGQPLKLKEVNEAEFTTEFLHFIGKFNRNQCSEKDSKKLSKLASILVTSGNGTTCSTD